MWCSKEYRHLHETEAVLHKAITEEENTAAGLAQLARALAVIIEGKRALREATRGRALAITLPKESLLVEATPDGTTPERGQP